jgi:hypothetical protein
MSYADEVFIAPTAAAPKTLDELLGPSLIGQLDRLDLLSRKILSGKLPGERRSKRRGRSVEFDDFRPYVPGDDLRHIDWNIVGRLDKLFIKLFREEEDLALQLVIDASASMDVGGGQAPLSRTPKKAQSDSSELLPSKLTYAVQLAMALGYIGLVNQNRVSAAVFGVQSEDPETGELTPSRVQELAPMRGRMSVGRLSDFLLRTLEIASRRAQATVISQDPLVTFDDAMRTLATTRAQRGGSSGARGITVVLSDFLFAQPPAGLRYVAGGEAGFDTYALQVLSPGELDPRTLLNDGLVGDLRLTDIESSRAQDVTVTPATIAMYTRGLERSIGALRAACGRQAIAHFLVRTDTPIADLTLNTLRRGGMLR